MRSKSLIRVLSIVRDCADGRRVTLYELADTYGVHIRTIRRDFYALEAAGFAIGKTPESGDGVRGLWWIERVPTALQRALQA